MNKKKVKIISILLAIAIIIFGGVYVADLFLGYDAPEIKTISDSNIKNTKDIKLTAHRGFSGVAPENTIAAFEKAAEFNFFAAECDVHLTKDGVWVIYHDDNIFRLTNGYKNIADATYDELQEYVIDNGVNVEKYPNQKIPTLEEFLVVCKDMNIVPQIEIKNGSKEKLQEILKLLDKYELRENSIIISFNIEALKTIRKLDKNIEIWYLVEEITDTEINECVNNNFALAFNHKKNSGDIIKTANDKKIKLCAWTVDDLEKIEQLYNMGVKYITTNSVIY
ncbi:MAG: glycerophosphodiester phosphodiesterase [Clostridia bacterium]|nr:glycerophosphodiester phosphodiesterase [Clostridia bacterium]